MTDDLIKELTKAIQELTAEVVSIHDGLERAKKLTRPTNSTLPVAPDCPKCSQPMRLRTAKANGEKFWGCRNYPDCKGTRSFLPPRGGMQELDLDDLSDMDTQT